MIIASIESLLGSFWFACFAAAAGYVAGHVFPISKIIDLIKKK